MANNEYKTKNLSSDKKITSSNLGTKPNDIILQYFTISYDKIQFPNTKYHKNNDNIDQQSRLSRKYG